MWQDLPFAAEDKARLSTVGVEECRMVQGKTCVQGGWNATCDYGSCGGERERRGLGGGLALKRVMVWLVERESERWGARLHVRVGEVCPWMPAWGDARGMHGRWEEIALQVTL